MRVFSFALVMAVALTACSAQTSAQPTVSPGGAACQGLVQPDGKAVRFGENDGLAGVVIGDGKAAVILAHQAPGSLCEWLPYARFLAGLGYRAMAFGQGVTQVFLYLCAEFDTSFVDHTKELYDLSGASKDRRMKITYGTGHGLSLLMPGVDNESGLEVTGFLKTYTKG